MNYSKRKKLTTKRLSILITVLLALLLPSCSKSRLEKSLVKINGTEIPVEIAKTPQERQQGLMERKKLDKESGMLFVFEQEQRLSFWMKNTSIPLSIAYISKNGEIKEILDMKPFSEASIRSKWSVKYALEVNQGFFVEHKIKEGDTVEIDKQFK